VPGASSTRSSVERTLPGRYTVTIEAFHFVLGPALVINSAPVTLFVRLNSSISLIVPRHSFLIPSSTVIFDMYPNRILAFTVLAIVLGTPPGCCGMTSIFAFTEIVGNPGCQKDADEEDRCIFH